MGIACQVLRNETQRVRGLGSSGGPCFGAGPMWGYHPHIKIKRYHFNTAET